MALLLHAKASSHFAKTNDMLSRLIRIVLQTGLLTSVLALLVLPLIFRKALSGIYSLPWYILGKSYAISLLANLNARTRSNAAAVVHGSDIDVAIPQSTKMSTMVFTPQVRRTEGGDINSTDGSSPVHLSSQTDSQSRSNTNLDADVWEDFNAKQVMNLSTADYYVFLSSSLERFHYFYLKFFDDDLRTLVDCLSIICVQIVYV